MATATERLWRTADGGLVRDGDEAATLLAYTVGDEIRPADEHLVPAERKAAEKPADKAMAKTEDKSAGARRPRS